MRRILILLAAILCVANVAWGGIYRNSSGTREDSIGIVFQPLDSLGQPISAASGDSVFLMTFYPGGLFAAADSGAFATESTATFISGTLTFHRMRATPGSYSPKYVYSYRNLVSNIDGAGENGTYTYDLLFRDTSCCGGTSNKALWTTKMGEFQVYTSTTHTFATNQDTVGFVNGLKTGAIVAGSFTAGAIDAAAIAASAITSSEAPNLDQAISTRMATYTQPTGFLAATFPTGTVANTTNITAGTIATVTNDVGIKAVDTVAVVLNVNNIASTDTITTVLGNVNGSVLSVINDVGIKGVDTVAVVLNVNNIASTDTITTVLGNVNGNVAGSVLSVTNDVGIKTTDTVAVVLKVNDINSLDTITTVLGNVNGSVGSLGATAKTDVETQVWTTSTPRVLTAGTNIALAKGTGVTGFNDITAAAVWDQDSVGHVVAGTMGHSASQTAAGGGGGLTSDQMKSIVWGAGTSSDSVPATSRYIANPGGSSAGTGSKPETLYVCDTLGPTRNRVANVKVTLQDSTNTNSSPPVLTSNGSGFVIFNVTALKLYNAYAEYGGYYWPVRSFRPSSGVTAGKDSIPGWDMVPSNTAPGVQKTTLYETAMDQAGNVLPYAKVTVTLNGSSEGYTSTNVVLPAQVVVTANSSGLWQAAIFGNDSIFVNGTAGSTTYNVKVTHSSLAQPVEYKSLFVPANGATTRLRSLLP